MTTDGQAIQPTSNTRLRVVGSEESDRVIPSDAHAEAAVLSTCMLMPVRIPLVADFLRAEHFFSEAHRWIFEAILALHTAGTAVDIVTVMTWLRERDRLPQVGGPPYLTQVLDATPAVANVREHAAAVFNAWRLRQIGYVARRIGATIDAGGAGDVQDFANATAAMLVEVARMQPGGKTERNIDALTRAVVEMQQTERDGKSKRMTGISTGIGCFDQLTGGLHAGDKLTIAALPGVGKSAFALQIAMHVAGLGIGVYFASTEMSRDELVNRQLAHLSGVDGQRIRRARHSPTFTAQEWSQITTAAKGLSALPILVDDQPGLTIDDICARANAHAETSMLVDKVPLGLIIIDYVQDLTSPPALARSGKPEQVAYATKRFKTLCHELKIPGIELAQQRDMDVDKKTGKRPPPRLGDIAWCKHVSKAANVEMYLWRADERDGRNITASIRKQRAGDEGEFWLSFDRKCGRFTDRRLEADRQYVDDGKAWYER